MSSSSDSSSEDEDHRRTMEMMNDDNIQPMQPLFPGMKWSSQERKEMFENLFGMINYGDESMGKATPPDTKDCLEVLSVAVTPEKAKERHDEIRRGCRGMVTMSTSQFWTSDKHKDANELFSRGRHVEALKKYKKLIKESPYDQRFYSNAALCYIQLGKFEKAITVVSDAVYIVGEDWAKGHLVYASAYAHLGYVAFARDYMRQKARMFQGADRNAAIAKVDDIAKGLTIKPKSLDQTDLKMTIERLLSPEVTEKQLTFLLIHLINHFHKSQGLCTGTMLPAICKAINKCPALNNLLKSKIAVEQLSYAQARILYLFLMLTTLFAMCCPSCSEELLKQGVFVSFLVDFGKVIATRATMRAVLRKQQYGQAAAITYSSFIAALSVHESIRSSFFQKTAPFNEFTWQVCFQAAYFVIMGFEERITTMLIQLTTEEPWFFSRLEKAITTTQKNELAVCLAMMASISRFDFKSHDEIGSLLPFWVKVSTDKRTAMACAVRPGVWTHFVRRLSYCCDQLKTSAKASADVEMVLKIFDSMLTTIRRQEQKKEIGPLTNPAEAENVKSLAKSLVFLVNCKRNCPKMSQASTVSVRTEAFKMIARLSACSLQFRQAVFTSSFSIADIISACTSDELAKIPGSALYCLAMFLRLSKNLNQVYNELAELPTLPDLIKRLVNLITTSNETDIFANACLSLYYLLGMKERVKNRVAASLNFDTNEEFKRSSAMMQKMVNVIVGARCRTLSARAKLMQLDPCAASLAAGILLPAVLTSDRSYRRLLRKAEIEAEEKCIPALDSLIEEQEEDDED